MDPLILNSNGKGKRLSCSAASARVRLQGNGDSLCITNPNAFNIYVVVGGATIEADLTGYLILPGTKEDNLVIDPNADYAADPWVAAICDAGLAGYLSIHRVSR